MKKILFLLIFCFFFGINIYSADENKEIININLGGLSYSLFVSPQDSAVSFYQVDKTKYNSYINSESNIGTFNIRIDGVDRIINIRIKEPITQEVKISYSVCDSIANIDELNIKSNYINHRISTLKYIIAELEEMKNMKGEKVKGTKYQRIFADLFLFPFYSENSSSDDDKLNKAGDCTLKSNIISIIFDYEKRIKKELDTIQSILELSMREFLSTPIPEPSTEIDLNGYWGKYEFRNKYVFDAKERDVEAYIKNPILSNTLVTRYNTAYRGAEYNKWEWLTLLNENGDEDKKLEHILKSYPTKVSYYKYSSHPEYKLYNNNYDLWYACNDDGSLVAVQGRFDVDYDIEKEILNSIQRYKYEHNAYNVKSEPKFVQLAIKKEIYNLKDEDEAVFMLSALGYYLGNSSQRKANAAKMKKIANSTPSYDEEKRANAFLSQIRQDYENIIKKSSLNTEQISGTDFRIRAADNSASFLLKYYLSKKEHKLCRICIIEKL